MSIKAVVRRISAGLAIAGSMCLVGCSGGQSSTSQPIPVATTPTITPSSGTYTSAQTVTVTGAAGTTVHCTLDGTTPTAASGPCASTVLNVNGTTVVHAYASQSGSTDSAMATSTIVIAIPVVQTIVLPATMTATFNTTIVLNSSLVTASSSCSPASVSWTLKSTDTDTSTVGVAVLAKYSTDITLATWGSVSTGNAPTKAKIGTYDLAATCGTASSTSRLTFTSAVPTVASATPNIFPPTGGSMTFTGTNFSANNSTTLTQWLGTLAASSAGACPATQPTLISGTTWISSTQAQWGFSSGGATLGPWNVSVINQPTALGTDGGWTCKAAVYTITATGFVSTAYGVVVLNPETGEMELINNGVLVATFNLGSSADQLLATEDAVYATQPSRHLIAKLDLQSRTLSFISTGDYTPLKLTKDSYNNVYAGAELTADRTHGAILRIGNASTSKISSADGLTSLSSDGSSLIWTSLSQDRQSTIVHELNTNAAVEKTLTIDRKADTVVILNGYAWVSLGGEKDVTVLDLDSFKESGTVSFPAGILGFSDGRFALTDGNIGEASIVSDGSGKVNLSWSQFAKEPVENLYAGFTVSTVNGVGKLFVMPRSAQGKLSPEAHPVLNRQ